jgi:hypothetical protein
MRWLGRAVSRVVFCVAMDHEGGMDVLLTPWTLRNSDVGPFLVCAGAKGIALLT